VDLGGRRPTSPIAKRGSRDWGVPGVACGGGVPPMRLPRRSWKALPSDLSRCCLSSFSRRAVVPSARPIFTAIACAARSALRR
jgi:hypothetical protein